ncbi:MAG: DUF2865 domain-containing protein [Hyphomicrobiaceae bacterium]
MSEFLRPPFRRAHARARRHRLVAAALAFLLALPSGHAPAFAQQAGQGGLFGIFSIFKPKPRMRPARPAFDATRLPTAGQSATISGGSDLVRVRALTGNGTADPTDLSRPQHRPRLRAGVRTVCVRLCDGYYWPVSDFASQSRVRRDSDVCESSCDAEARLYVQPTLGSDPEDMRDLSGKPYKKLKSAFLYRKRYLPECRCRPEPWSQSELIRHEEYAILERQRELNQSTGDRVAADVVSDKRTSQGMLDEEADPDSAMIASLPADGEAGDETAIDPALLEAASETDRTAAQSAEALPWARKPMRLRGSVTTARPATPTLAAIPTAKVVTLPAATPTGSAATGSGATGPSTGTPASASLRVPGPEVPEGVYSRPGRAIGIGRYETKKRRAAALDAARTAVDKPAIAGSAVKPRTGVKATALPVAAKPTPPAKRKTGMKRRDIQ